MFACFTTGLLYMLNRIALVLNSAYIHVRRLWHSPTIPRSRSTRVLFVLFGGFPMVSYSSIYNFTPVHSNNPDHHKGSTGSMLVHLCIGVMYVIVRL